MAKYVKVNDVNFTLFVGESVYAIYPPEWKDAIGEASSADEARDVAKAWLESPYDGGDPEAAGLTWEQVLKL